MNNIKPWVTVVALYAFAAFLGGLFTFVFLTAVGAIDGVHIVAGVITLGDLAAPTISAVAIVVTMLIAAKGWDLQRKEKEAERGMLVRERRNTAKVDRMRLAHILSEILASSKIYIDELLTFAEGSPKKDKIVPKLSIPENTIDKIIAVAAKQEEPLLSALGELSSIMQMKQARSRVYQETLINGGTRGVQVILKGKTEKDKILDYTYKELYEILVVYSRCLVLFGPARYFLDEPYTGDVEPSPKDFERSMMLSGVAFSQPASEAVLRRANTKSRCEL